MCGTSVAAEGAIRERVVEILGEVDERLALLRSFPDAALGEGERFVWLLSFRCHRLFRSIAHLLGQGLALEAEVLLRTLHEDATLMAFMVESWAEDPNNLEVLALTFARESLAAEREVWEKIDEHAPTLGTLPPRPDFARRQRALDAAWDRRAKKGRVPFLNNHFDRLKRVGREYDYWFYKVSSQSVHTRILTLFRLEPVRSTGVQRWTDDDEAITSAAEKAAGQLFQAYGMANEVLGWIPMRHLMSWRDEIIVRLTELEALAAGDHDSAR